MGRKIEKKKNEKGDNFYKYDPKHEAVGYESPKFSFKKNEVIENEAKINRLGPGSYGNLKKGISESYTIPKDQRFKPLVKEKAINSKVNENAYSTVGFMPKYLRRKEKRKDSFVQTSGKENIE